MGARAKACPLARRIVMERGGNPPIDKGRSTWSEMYTACFDESGHAASGGLVALAGFVARDETWEYLMRHFATESGKSKGQFYTLPR
jgi:N-6 DNA methylase